MWYISQENEKSVLTVLQNDVSICFTASDIDAVIGFEEWESEPGEAFHHSENKMKKVVDKYKTVW